MGGDFVFLGVASKRAGIRVTLQGRLQDGIQESNDDAAAIGRRYRRQDEVGTPFGITIDPESTANGTVTIRFRDDLQQIRVDATQVGDVIAKYIAADHATAEVSKLEQ